MARAKLGLRSWRRACRVMIAFASAPRTPDGFTTGAGGGAGGAAAGASGTVSRWPGKIRSGLRMPLSRASFATVTLWLREIDHRLSPGLTTYWPAEAGTGARTAHNTTSGD